MKKLLAIFSTISIAFAVLSFTPIAANAALKNQTATVALSGTPMVSGTLFADISGLKSGSAIKYTWKVDGVTQGTEESFYLGNSEFAGTTIKLYISAKKSGYKEWKYTSPNIVEGEVSQLKAGSISGSLLTGYQLEADCGTFLPALGSAESSSVCEVQWQKDGQNIDGATGTTLELTSEDIGFHISAIILVTANGVYGIEKSLTKSGVVLGTLDIAEDPTFTEVGIVGDIAEFASLPTWTVEPDTTKFQWYRSGKKISGATNSYYTIKSDDWHKSLSVKVSASKANYQSISASFTVVSYVYKISTKTGTTLSGYAAWDSCDYYDYDSYDCWKHTSNGKWAVAYNFANYEDDYTLMNLSAYNGVNLDNVIAWRAVVTGTTGVGLLLLPSSDEGIDYVDTENSSYYGGDGTWRTNWSTISATGSGLYHFGIYTNEWGGFVVKSVKIEVRYIH